MIYGDFYTHFDRYPTLPCGPWLSLKASRLFPRICADGLVCFPQETGRQSRKTSGIPN
jgi:hypothetical protein